MALPSKGNDQTEYIWRTYLTTGQPPKEAPTHWAEGPMFRTLARKMPKEPRCRTCGYPFEGVGGLIARNIAGIKPSKMNPNLCNICERFGLENQGGAEILLSMLFCDVRGSTTIAEAMSPHDYSDLIQRFFQAASTVLFNTNAMVEKLIGDEAAGLYVPGNTGEDHAHIAVGAAKSILKATGHDQPEGPWIPVGAGVHTGIAFVGSIVADGVTDITALGDAVNLAARLASIAKAGEVVISEDTRQAAGLPKDKIEGRELQLKGRNAPVQAWILKVGS